MPGVPIASPKVQFLDAAGIPLAMGYVTTYLAGTTTLSPTWRDRDQAVANLNPILLDASGSADLILDPALYYRMVVTDAAGVIQAHLGGDNIAGAAGAQVLGDVNAAKTTALAEIDAASDAAEVLMQGYVADAQSAANAAQGTMPIFTGVRTAAVTAGLAATASGSLFSTREQYGSAVDVWLDNAGTAVWQETVPFGIGEQAAQIKAIEGATIESWVEACGSPPDYLFDSLDFLLYGQDGRLIPNAMRVQTNPPTKNLSGIATGDHYFGTGGTHTDVKRVVGAGGLNTGVEVTFAGNNVNVDYIPVINAEVMDPGTYTLTYKGNSKVGKGAQTIQWFETAGSTTQTDNHAEGAYVAKSFTFTVATRASISVRLRSTVAASAFNLDQWFIWENDGNANPGFVDNSIAGHARNKFSGRGTFLAKGLFIDTSASALTGGHDSFSLAANGLPVDVNDLTVFVSARLANVVHANTSPAINFTPFDGSSPVDYNMGVGNSSPEGPISDGAISSYPTPLQTHRLVLKGEDFHVWGASSSVETMMKGLDGLVYWNHARSAAAAPLFSSRSRLGLFNGIKGDFAQVAVWVNKGGTLGAKPFSVAQVKGIMAKMRKHVVARGGTMESFRDIMLNEGDSRNNYNLADPSGPAWNWQLGAFEFFGAGTTSLKVPQLGWGSSVLGLSTDTTPPGATDINYVGSSLWSRRPETLATIEACHELGLRIHFTWLNDINDTVRIPANATQYCADERVLMAQYYDALVAGGLGSQLALFTCMPRHTDATFEAARPTVNTLRRNTTTYAGCYHYLIDAAADPVMGLYSGTTAPPGWVDSLHPNKAGGTILANLAKPWLSARRLY